jgi:hypothetical protein
VNKIVVEEIIVDEIVVSKIVVDEIVVDEILQSFIFISFRCRSSGPASTPYQSGSQAATVSAGPVSLVHQEVSGNKIDCFPHENIGKN